MLTRFVRSCSERLIPSVVLLFVTAVVTRCPAPCNGQVVPVEETFRGMGEFETVGGALVGMDNPSWFFGGTGQLTPDGYLFHDRGVGGIDASKIHRFQREVIGTGSYVQTLELSDLELSGITQSPSPTASAGVVMTDIQSRGEGNTFVLFTLRDWPGVPPDQYRLAASIFGEFGTMTAGEAVFVPRGSDVSLEIEFNEHDREVILTYDADTATAEVDWSSSYSYSIPPFDIHEMEFSIHQNSEGETDGIIEYWSLRPLSDIFGDFSGNASLDVEDIDLLVAAISAGNHDTSFDLTGDGFVDFADLTFWVHDVRKTYFGDANVDGEFNSRDFVNVFEAAEYEDDVDGNSTWRTGDWNTDRDFTTSDFVFAFQDGGYEKGPRAGVVPEPSCSLLLLVAAILCAKRSG